ncbi:MAG: hypothetical protein KGI89_17480, partial [Euryarchaeota archaeon]|nr:hypothetical protein [Euryarchaeota archaeon]
MAADKEVRVNLQFSASGNAEEGLRRIGAAAEAAAASEKRLNSSMDETVAAGGRMPRRLASAESFYRTASGDAADTATAARSPAAYPWPFRYGAPVQPAASSYPAGVPGYAAPGGSRATGYSSAQAVAVGGSSEPRAASLRDAAYALRVVSLEAEAATARLAGTVSTLRGVGVGRQAQSNPAAVPLTRAAENRHDHSRGADRRTVSVLWRSEGGPVGPGGEHAELPAPRGRDRRLVYAEDDEHVVNAPAARANRPLLNLMNKVRGPVSWAAAKGRQLNEFITDRYGPRWGAAAKYGGPALSWAAFGAGAAMGQFVYVPIPVATGAIAGAAELYYQRHKIAAGAGKLAGTWRDVLFGNEQ